MKDNEKLTDKNVTQETSHSGEWRNFTKIEKYKRANKYDYNWIEDNWMGPNPLYLAEELCANMDLRPGMKVLDMGCGKGCSSVFLAKEYGVTVFATDLWISAAENLQRFEEAGAADLVFPIHADAHSLPYAEGFFDAAVSLNAYHYFGTSDTYFPQTYSKLVKTGGQFGFVINGLINEDKWTCWTKDESSIAYHSGEWWRKHLMRSGLVEITACYDFDDPESSDKGLYACGEREGHDTSNFALIVMAAKKSKGEIQK